MGCLYLLDWTTGLIDFTYKCTEMLHNVFKVATTVINQHAGYITRSLVPAHIDENLSVQ